jgi:hypothetical protein
MRHQAKQATLLSYFKKNSEEPPTDPKTAEDDPVDPDDPVRDPSSVMPTYLYFTTE